MLRCYKLHEYGAPANYKNCYLMMLSMVTITALRVDPVHCAIAGLETFRHTTLVQWNGLVLFHCSDTTMKLKGNQDISPYSIISVLL